MNAKDEQYSETRLEKVLAETRLLDVREICETVEKDIYTFTAGYEQSDDITMLVFKFNKFYENKT
jgi:serine phosphatase RsbU (regulator of sigma subunit)